MNYSNLLSRPHQHRPLSPKLLRRIRRVRKAAAKRAAPKAVETAK